MAVQSLGCSAVWTSRVPGSPPSHGARALVPSSLHLGFLLWVVAMLTARERVCVQPRAKPAATAGAVGPREARWPLSVLAVTSSG